MAGKTVICKDVHGKEYEVQVSQLRWRPSAYGIVIRAGKILLSKQFDSYDLPGGGVELGETPEEAVVREVKEETGMEVRSRELLTTRTSFFTWPDPEAPEHNEALMFYYACELVGGELSMDGFDEDEKIYADMPEWVPLEKLDSFKPASTVDWRPIVRQAIAD
ncbi:MAG TPA: NUDIX domain-containing protein [Candidatus Saccharimonadales bacterium]|nr:NUDIX domain-containing protein [Candidatus Saccharimonadales bacterium]